MAGEVALGGVSLTLFRMEHWQRDNGFKLRCPISRGAQCAGGSAAASIQVARADGARGKLVGMVLGRSTGCD